MDVVNFQKASPAPGVQASVGRLWEQLKVQDKKLHISGDGKMESVSMVWLMFKKPDAVHEPECSHVEHFCETSSTFLCMFPLLPYQCTVDCGMWKRMECKVWSVECGVQSVEPGV